MNLTKTLEERTVLQGNLNFRVKLLNFSTGIEL
jgi:hypothetical protein